MLVPKLVLNGFVRPLRFWEVLGLASALEFFISTRLLEPAEACRNGIKTIFDHFRNTHAR
jgi:hypothetical protein